MKLIFTVLVSFSLLPFLSAQQIMQVKGRHLYDPCGEQVVLWGINEMFIWSDDPTGEKIMPEITKTGANAVRIVWLTDQQTAIASPENLDKVIQNSIANTSKKTMFLNTRRCSCR
ncbi:MAG: hypothetical protein JJU28_09345 [Cyclobacteriaceae bacterium]|nr:hypothetical protein [Cyclobacteriaceae bacterium]